MKPLPEIMLRSATVVPPITLLVAPPIRTMPSEPFARAAVPAAFVPTLFPMMPLLVTAPSTRIP